MPTALWIVSIAMTIAAVLLIARPLAGPEQRRLLVITVVAVPVFAFVVYLLIGSPGVGSAHVPESAMVAPAGNALMAGSGTQQTGSVASLVGGLAGRLQENPDDAGGWLLLAKSYNYLGRREDALHAYARAVELGEFDASLDALASGKAPAEVVTQPAESGAVISGTVSLSDAAAAIVQATDTVFIFARPAGQGGAPAAVVQRPASDWPIQFRLSDAQSMVDGIRLSNYDEVVVTARISRGGNAAAALQGLEAKSEAVKVAAGEPVDLFIQ